MTKERYKEESGMLKQNQRTGTFQMHPHVVFKDIEEATYSQIKISGAYQEAIKGL